MDIKHYDICPYLRSPLADGKHRYSWVNLGDGTEAKQCNNCGAHVIEKIEYKRVSVRKLTPFGLKYAVAVAEGLDIMGIQLRESKNSPLWVRGHYDFGFDPDTDHNLFYDLMIKHKAWVSPPIKDGDAPVGWDVSIYSDDDMIEYKAIGQPNPMIGLCQVIVQKFFKGHTARVRIPVRLLDLEAKHAATDGS